MKKCINGKIVDMTTDEINIHKERTAKSNFQKAHRQLSAQEATDVILKKLVNTVDVDDSLSIRMKDYYPTFDEVVGTSVGAGFKFTYIVNEEVVLFKTLSSMTIQAHYPPITGTESLYAKIDEVHTGDVYDPIPYNGNMALENGKYYTQADVVYVCIRDTVNPVYNNLKDLVGLYLEEV